MILNIPVEDLLASQLDIILGVDGSLAYKFNYSHKSDSPALQIYRGLAINFESLRAENGLRLTISFSASQGENARLSIPNDSPSAMQDSSHSIFEPVTDSVSPMSLLLSETCLPPNYFSTYDDTGSSHPLPCGKSKHQSENFDSISNSMSPDVNCNQNSECESLVFMGGQLSVQSLHASYANAASDICDQRLLGR